MGLRAYIIRRLLLMIPTLIGVTILIFAVLQFFSPAQRAALFVDKPGLNIKDIIESYNLNAPVWEQYLLWVRTILKGNLGWSSSIMMPVKDVLLQRWPATAELVVFSVPPIIFIGIYLGVKSAVHRDKPLDHATRVLAIIGWSLPSFWLGIILLSIFWAAMNLTSGGRLSVEALTYVDTSGTFVKYTGFYTIDGLLNGQIWITLDALKHLVLPVVTLVVISMALIIRVMRSSMLESLNRPYITMARAKGLDRNEVVSKHARRNALIPTITISGLLVAGMLNGVVITETVFGIPGLGAWAASAAITLDVPAVLGFALFSGSLFVISNLVVDILYAYIDPRIRLG